MVEVNNLTTNKIDQAFLKGLAKSVLDGENKKMDISVALVGQTNIRELNKKYRSKNKATDVLSFQYDNFGEIVICLREVKKNEGLEIDLRHLNYPIFLAHIDKVDSRTGEISEWLEERLNVVLEQWKEWQNKAELNDIERIATKFDKDEKIKESQKTLFSKVDLDKINIEKSKKTKPKEGKSETKISKNLEDLLG